MMEKQFTKYNYRQPKVAVINVSTREVIATSPELELQLNSYEEEEW